MNGPKHAAEAERLLAEATEQDAEWANIFIAKAQVHATLALTEWGKRNAEVKPLIEEAEPEPTTILHESAVFTHHFPIPGSDKLRTAFTAKCSCGAETEQFESKADARTSLDFEHVAREMETKA